MKNADYVLRLEFPNCVSAIFHSSLFTFHSSLFTKAKRSHRVGRVTARYNHELCITKP